jgi:HSP20 family molecular chaperone IbpA
MKNNPQDIFREMDAMMARLFTEMDDGLAFDQSDGFGYRIVIPGGMGADQEPEPEKFHSRDTQEPVAEVHRIDNEVKVIVEMPGVSEENLNIQQNGQTLTIDAAGSVQTYHTTAALPPVDPVSIRHTLKNGVLEVSFESLPKAP